MSITRAARIGDQVKSVCDCKIHSAHHNCPHNTQGRIAQGSENVFFNGIGAARLGDEGFFDSCQHGGSFKCIEGSGTVFVNGKAAIRVKDTIQCVNPMCGEEGSVIDGADTVFIGG